ncbi:kinesin-like protein KIN-14I isoform X2 [Folsomia candida]|uniref:kinesin-like protein KIN-14I isoform X2 n=1 Tax=Folsomia candida TaxID=158441 RepID=UPI001604FB1D|nr:kinesin-like protein KIN-14I isoform X2 [Folsomia candida]
MKTLDFRRPRAIFHRSDTTPIAQQQSLTAQMKHLDMMCVTLERQIDVLSNVDQALPPTENIYSGEPDSLDGTSSEIMINDDLMDPLNNNVGRVANCNFQINGRSPLDALAMLHLERCAHRETRRELTQLHKKYEVLRDEFDSGEGLSTSLLFSRMHGELEEDDMFGEREGEGTTGMLDVNNNEESRLAEETRLKEMIINQLRSRLIHLEKARMDKVPVDTAQEISKLHSTLVQLERVRDELTLQNFTLKSKLAELSARISDSTTYRLEKSENVTSPPTGHRTVTISSGTKTVMLASASPSPTPTGSTSSDEGVGGINSTSTGSSSQEELKLRRKSTYKVAHTNSEANVELKQLRSLINDLHSKEVDYQARIRELELELRNARNQESCKTTYERNIRSLEDRLESTQRRLESAEKCILAKEEESSALKLDLDTLNEENKRLKGDLNVIHLKVEKEHNKSMEKILKFEKELGSILETNRVLQEDFYREKLLRKRFYNMVEELKGKIRVFCRIRPLAKNEKASDVIAQPSDPYTVSVDTPKGHKEFQFDRVFTPEECQEQVFCDTQNLIQSAFDGYNVCICAYGQTGSGKTYTILGDEINPGIAPRTFSEIFSIAKETSHSYETTVSFYVLELYNDKLIDLLNPNGTDCDRLEIRKDRRGTVWVAGARVLPAEDSVSLNQCFKQALNSRHTACTRMNERSSRSHLIIGLVIESTSKVNGTVLRGKISLVDLAGSERTGKSGVSADTLREANAINKSLSAFGDVINALTSDQSFVPYRNNKLTLLMQDSLGGNAKTLMFVNVSPSNYNVDETIMSLTYATRVKQVTNGATRNAESKEVARLKNVINKLRRGDPIPSDFEDI